MSDTAYRFVPNAAEYDVLEVVSPGAHRVFDALKQVAPAETLRDLYAPIGLDIGADSPAEIAVSVIGEILQVLRKRKGGHLRGAS